MNKRIKILAFVECKMKWIWIQSSEDLSKCHGI